MKETLLLFSNDLISCKDIAGVGSIENKKKLFGN